MHEQENQTEKTVLHPEADGLTLGNNILGDYLLVKAEENGVTVIGLTRGKETRFHHNEKLDKGEVMIFQFTTHTSAMKIRGKAKIYSRYGIVDVGV